MDYYFAATGEIRKPKKDEWFKNSDGEFIICNPDEFPFKREIYVRHEVERPEGADHLHVSFETKDHGVNSSWHQNCSGISLPVKKVKRWKWSTLVNGCRVTTDEYFSERPQKAFYWEKVEDSEVEG